MSDTATHQPPQGVQTETSWLPRIVTILTPFAAMAAGWIAAWVADHTGVQLDQTQITAFMVAVALSTLGAGWKWLTGWQQHERLVAQGLAVPVRKSRERAPKAPPAVIPVPVLPATAEAVVE